jgi:hypothetical protein
MSSDDYDDNRKLQPLHGSRTYIPSADEQFDVMGFPIDPDLGAEEEEEE